MMKKKRILCIISIVLVIVSFVGLVWIMINEESGRGSMDDIRWICFFLVLGSISISIVIIELLVELYSLMRDKKK